MHYCFTPLGDAVSHYQVNETLEVLSSAFHLSFFSALINRTQLNMYRLGAACQENCRLKNVMLFVSVTK